MWIRHHVRVRVTGLLAATVAFLASASVLADSRLQSNFEQWAAIDTERSHQLVGSYSAPTRVNADGKVELLDTKTIPVSHWRPWFVPRTPHPFDGAPPSRDADDRKATVMIKEVAASN